MADESSNEKALYDDMLDKHLASVISKSGKFGVAQSIERQLAFNTVTESDLENQTTTPAISVVSQRSKMPALPASVAFNISDRSPIPGLSNRDLERFRESAGLAQTTNMLSPQKQAFIDPLLPHANRNARRLGTSANAILAVAALESGWGQKVMSDKNGRQSHNLFGIKAFNRDVDSVNALTTEYIDGKPQKIHDRFRVFKNRADAVDGFANFILDNPRYQQALQHASDPRQFLIELQRAGYATDPKYADKAITVLQQIENSRRGHP